MQVRMQNVSRQSLTIFLVLGVVAVAGVAMTTFVNTWMFQEADAVKCNRDVIAVCGVCVNANVIGQDVSQRCNQ
jgi:formate-dependent nitrite reductase membrane component NrfD